MQPAASPSGSGADRRRSERLLLVMPVVVTFNGKDGARIREQAESEIINRHGGLLRLSTTLPLKTGVALLNPRNQCRVDAHVVIEGQRGTDGRFRVAVEFKAPSAKFWGVHFPDDSHREDLKTSYTGRR